MVQAERDALSLGRSALSLAGVDMASVDVYDRCEPARHGVGTLHPSGSVVVRILILHSRYLSDWASGRTALCETRNDCSSRPAMRCCPDAHRSRLSLMRALDQGRSGRRRRSIRFMVCSEPIDPTSCTSTILSRCYLQPCCGRAGTATGLVVTLHNYRMLCLPATCIRDGEICELCVGHIPWRGVVHRCYRGSVLGSAALATSLTAHRAFGTFDHVSLFLPVSGFVRDKHLEAGFSRDRMWVKPNFCWPRPRRDGAGDDSLYAGRLAPEKDVRILLEAWRGMAGYRLIVVGDGPEMEASRSIAPPGVEFRERSRPRR